MSEPNQQQPTKQRRFGAALSVLLGVVRFALVVGLLGAGFFAAYFFNTTSGTSAKSKGERGEASRLVEIDIARRGDIPVIIRAMGTVTPAREAVISPRVNGEIVEQAKAFVPGGIFRAGEFMVQLDRRDYEQQMEQRLSELARAEANLLIELGDQAVAREELELLQVDIPEINRDLILRIPQVNQARADVRAAQAAIEQAQLDLDRTRIAAPFDGHIVRRTATIGNNVGPGDEVATLVGAQEYWIEVTVPVSSLRWIESPRVAGEPASIARIFDTSAWGEEVFRLGEVFRRVGRLEQGSRLARLLVRVPDPLAMGDQRAEKPELILGAFVDVEIRGRELPNAFVIDRDLLREGDVVWLMDENDRLEIREVTVAYRGRDEVYITEGLTDGDFVVRTNLSTPVQGMLLRADPSTLGSRAMQPDPTTEGRIGE